MDAHPAQIDRHGLAVDGETDIAAVS